MSTSRTGADSRDELREQISAAGIEIDVSGRRLQEYSYDASNYRVPPLAVVFPQSVQDVAAVVRACAATNTALTSRGGGTSMAGNAVGPGVVLDFSRYMNKILDVDLKAGIADVQPGVVLADLAAHVEQVSSARLTFAPDPSSKNRATVGGSVANDACGNHSVRYGRTSDHIWELDLVTADGSRLTATNDGVHATDPDDAVSAARAATITDDLTQLVHKHLAAFRLELGRIQRQVVGLPPGEPAARKRLRRRPSPSRLGRHLRRGGGGEDEAGTQAGKRAAAVCRVQRRSRRSTRPRSDSGV
ncbi:FAD-binding oxidoreductase [Streptomyces sp. NPDC052042]|uniref:FAD-binding oxidoreductase n=1 Tax=Streptomyces sp. NPDC052042 TaxID=3365683 RepID=UPI0037CE9401